MKVDKNKEREILELVYRGEKNYKIIDDEETEKPDFIVKNIKTDELFGVEITNLYYNPTSAKLKNISGYSNDLQKKVPKSDKKYVSTHKIYLDVGNGDYAYLTDRICLKNHTMEDYIDVIEKTILNKQDKSKNYNPDLSYLELFIMDRENYFEFKNIENLKYILNSPKINKAIDESNFRRVYFFTIINNKKIILTRGDYTIGPLSITEEELKNQKKFLNELINK